MSDAEPRMVHHSVFLTEDIDHEIQSAAAKLGVRRSELMRRFVSEGLAELARSEAEGRASREAGHQD